MGNMRDRRRDELTLLLTTARLLRATLVDFFPSQVADIEDLSVALAPFGPSAAVEPVDGAGADHRIPTARDDTFDPFPG
jgi:hypothetical protein